MATLEPGRRIARFALVRRLGRGGFGDVWEAADEGIARRVAIKFLTRATDAQDLERFRREARTAAMLVHPNIAAVYESGEIDGVPYIVMEYVDGEPLGRARLDARASAAAVASAARAIAAAHERNVLHRDLKPANVMIDRAGRVVVMDFGLARLVKSASTITASGLMVGTPAYMSPEQARGEVHSLDARADIWGLGATLYELIEGQPPFDGQDALEIAMKVVQDDAPRMKRAGGDLEAVVMRCLEKDREKRYRSADELADDLERYLRGESVSVSRLGPLRRARMWISRRRLIAIAALAVIVGVAAVALTWSASRRGAHARGQLLAEMRATSDAGLQAALDLKRSGSLAGMERISAQVEEVCRRVILEMPELAEPHHRIARLLRAQRKEKEARDEVETALAKDPAFGPALYERMVLMSTSMKERRLAISADWVRLEGARLAREGKGTVRALTRSGQSGPPETLKADEADVALLAATLQVLEEHPVRAAEMDCARGILYEFNRDLKSAREVLARAVADPDPPEEAFENLALVELAAGNVEESIRCFDEAIKRDLGGVRLLQGRAGVRFFAVRRRPGRADEMTAMCKAALADTERVAAMAPNDAILLMQGSLHLRVARIRQEAGSDDEEGALRSALAAFERAAALPGAGALEQSNLGIVWGRLADRRIRRGEDAKEAYEKALAHFAQAVRLAPERPEPFHSRALVLFNRGLEGESRGVRPDDDYRAAIEDLGAALKADPTESETWTMRGLVRANLAAATGGAQVWREAVSDLDQAVTLKDAGDAAWSSRGFILMRWACWDYSAGRDAEELHDRALTDLGHALSLNKHRADSWNYRAQAWSNRATFRLLRGEAATEDLARAIADADEAVRLAPESSETRRVRADIQTNAAAAWRVVGGGDVSRLLEQALADVTAALERNPSEAESWIARGTIRIRQAELEGDAGRDLKPLMRKAVEDLDRALKVNPQSWEARLRKADTYAAVGFASRGTSVSMAEGSFRHAIHFYDEALLINPRRFDGWVSRGRVRMQLGVIVMGRGEDPLKIYAGAIEDLDRALDAQPAHAEAMLTRAMTRHNRSLWYGAKGGGDPAAEAKAALEDYARVKGRLKAEADRLAQMLK